MEAVWRVTRMATAARPARRLPLPRRNFEAVFLIHCCCCRWDAEAFAVSSHWPLNSEILKAD